MLTGLRALDPSRPSDQHNLVDWAKPYLSDSRKLARLLDPRLEGRYPSKGAALAAQLTLRCLSGDPRSRPSMKEVLAVLEEVESMKARPKEGGSASPGPGTRRNNRGSSGLGPGQPSPRIRWPQVVPVGKSWFHLFYNFFYNFRIFIFRSLIFPSRKLFVICKSLRCLYNL